MVQIHLEAKPRTKKEMSVLINRSRDSLGRLLRDNGIKTSRKLLEIDQQEEILQLVGFMVKWII